MPRPAPPNPKVVAQVVGIAKALEAEGFSAGGVQVAADGGWSLSWAKATGQGAQMTPLEEFQARKARNG